MCVDASDVNIMLWLCGMLIHVLCEDMWKLCWIQVLLEDFQRNFIAIYNGFWGYAKIQVLYVNCTYRNP